jgi:hypothetical protein
MVVLARGVVDTGPGDHRMRLLIQVRLGFSLVFVSIADVGYVTGPPRFALLLACESSFECNPFWSRPHRPSGLLFASLLSSRSRVVPLVRREYDKLILLSELSLVCQFKESKAKLAQS